MNPPWPQQAKNGPGLSSSSNSTSEYDQSGYSRAHPAIPAYPYTGSHAQPILSQWNPDAGQTFSDPLLANKWYMPDNAGPSSTQISPLSYSSSGHPAFPSPSTKTNFTPPERGISVSENADAAFANKGEKRRKRKKAAEEGTSPSGDGEKRTKTGRACDACRTKKIRCDIIHPSSSDDSPVQPICAHCKQYDLECTFFLPITETRFKKKKAVDQSEPSPTSVSGSIPLLASAPPTVSNFPRKGEDQLDKSPAVVERRFAQGWQGRVEGPTSISFLVHTSLPPTASESYDLRHYHSWEVSEDGDGLVRVNAPPTANENDDDPSRTHNRLNKPLLSAHTISLLVNEYFDHLAPLFPILSKADFTSRSNPSPLLLYCICGIAATRRKFPRDVYTGVRRVINGMIRSNDILSDARFENVQALWETCMLSPRLRLQVLVCLGIARQSEWYGAALGLPLLVDLLDCDVLLPAPYDIKPESDPTSWPIDPSYLALSEHLKLSILIGRVLKTIYSPTGLKYATDVQLTTLLADMTNWMEALPEELRFSGLLHLSHAALQFLFWRVFMRLSFDCPSHITFNLDIAQWSKIVRWSREAVEWLSHNDDALDTLFVYAYTATSCALVQYHTWARRKDPAALETLRLIKDTVSRWEAAVQPEQMSIRRKTCETMTLLYEAALKTGDSEEMSEKRNLNPTPGVAPRQKGGPNLVFVKDASRAGGGVYMASNEEDRIRSGLERSDVLLSSDMEKKSDNDSMEIFQNLQTAATNVNPQMNNEGTVNGNSIPVINFANQNVGD
ncbi:hypothetical protein P7C73_g1636, partial [Tremellales sp. Uapishka_1]